MRKLIIVICLFLNISVKGQKKLFYVYTDSANLVNDANNVIADFTAKVNAIKHVSASSPLAILNTKPYLIFFSSKSNRVNLPIWYQVMLPQKEFFTKLSGSEKEGEKVFGLFFNGFYLPHELGHALQFAVNKKETNQYQNEYFTNIVAILYWKKVKRNKELKQCYKYAKKMVGQLKNPVPEGEDPIRYFNDHYNELSADPYKYGYFQFAQFVKIYEDKSLVKFDRFIREFLIK